MKSNVIPNVALGKKLDRWSIFLSVLVFLLVVMMRRVKLDIDYDFTFLTGVNAFLNSVTSILLIIALYMVKNGKIEIHKRVMTAALVSSVLFLLCYVMYHFTTEETRLCQQGFIRLFYFFILISHIILAAVSLPFILFTYVRAFTHQYEKHKALARKVYPVWLYVSITGPIVYLLLRPCYS
jgi:putative membrane protein